MAALYDEGDTVLFDGGCPLGVLEHSSLGLALATDGNGYYYLLNTPLNTPEATVLGTYRHWENAARGIQEAEAARQHDPIWMAQL